jgi:hypothetical protein
MTNRYEPALIIVIILLILAHTFLVIGCASVGSMRSSSLMPVVVLEHSDGTEDWGRILLVTEDSLVIRRMEDWQSIPIDPNDIVRAFLVERKPTNYPLSILAGTLVMAGTWGIVVELNNGDTSTGSVLLAGATGIVPATLVAVKVADWTRKYRIIPLRVIGENGRLNLLLLRQELNLNRK